MKITVFGSTGPAGIEVIQKALDCGHEVAAYARNPAKLSRLRHDNLRVIQGELSDAGAMTQAISGADAVISLLGPGVIIKGTELSKGMENIVNAMKACGVKRLIALSTASVRDEHDLPDNKFKFIVGMIKTIFPGAYKEIIKMGDIIRSSGLDWTLVRVGLLTNSAGTKVVAGYYGQGIVKDKVSRKSIAKFMLDLLRVKGYIQKAPAISN